MHSELQAVLAKVDLFSRVQPSALAQIVGVGRIEHWQAGALVLQEDAHGPRLLVVLRGHVEIVRSPHGSPGATRAIRTLGPGDIVGEMSLLLDLPRTATVRAKTEAEIFTIDRAAFQELLVSDDPAFLRLGYELSRVLAQRLMALNTRIQHLLAGEPELAQRYAQSRQEVFELWQGTSSEK